MGGRDFPTRSKSRETYDPATPYQVRVQLHGGVGRPMPRRAATAGSARWPAPSRSTSCRPHGPRRPGGATPGREPAAILDRVKRTYNVDENRVALSGVSDGGTGAYYVAMRDTTPFASFLPLNGSSWCWRTRRSTDGESVSEQPRNKPFFIVNGGRDPLYPTARWSIRMSST